MWVFLLSLAVLFAASMIGYLIMIWFMKNRTNYVDAAGEVIKIPPMPDLPHLPYVLFGSTAAIVLSSATMQFAVRALRRDQHAGLLRAMAATLLLAAVFLVLQAVAWLQWVKGPISAMADHDAYRFAVTAFLVLSALHALHVVGGIVPMIVVTFRAAKRRYSSTDRLGVENVALYWHFLDVVWIIMFTCLLLFT